MTPEQTRQAQLRVAERAENAEDCQRLLAMLGLLDTCENTTATGLVCQGCGRSMMPSLTRGCGPVPEGWARQQRGNRCYRCYRTALQQLKPEAPTELAAPQPVRSSGPQRRCPNRPQDIGFQVRVAKLRAVHGRTWMDIAAELGCAPRTARSAFAQVVTL
jgi:hypothetical protein